MQFHAILAELFECNSAESDGFDCTRYRCYECGTRLSLSHLMIRYTAPRGTEIEHPACRRSCADSIIRRAAGCDDASIRLHSHDLIVRVNGSDAATYVATDVEAFTGSPAVARSRACGGVQVHYGPCTDDEYVNARRFVAPSHL